MQDWAPIAAAWVAFAAIVFPVFLILALFLPRKHVLLLGTAAVAGIVATMLFDWRVPQRHSEVMYQVIYLISALCVVSAILGYLWPWKAWQWGLTPFLAQAIWQVVGPYSTVGWGKMGAIPYVIT